MKRKNSSKKMTRSQKDKKLIMEKEKLHKKIRREMGKVNMHCKKGYIVREGYDRKSYTRKSGSRIQSARVAPKCIKKRGKSGSKGKQLFVLKSNELGRHGYHNVEHLSAAKRHQSLYDAMNEMPALSVYRKLNALYLVNRNTNPTISDIFKQDANWIKNTTEYKNRPTARTKSKSSKK
jgi:hypothetical protein